MARYQPGNFSHFSKEERMVAMQYYSKKLQASLLESDGHPDWGPMNDELDDLCKKMTIGKSATVFDKDVFFQLMRKFNSDEAYKTEIISKIDGTWVKPVKARQPKTPKVVKEVA